MNLPGYRRFGDYTLLGEIASGGMGVVHQAVHTGMNRPCALKLIRSGTLATTAERARFVAEAEAAAGMDHPHIVRVRQAGEAEGQLFLEMELVEGGTLADRLAAGPLPAREAAVLVARLARAVQHAHDRGVLHRDLKPGNVLLADDGTPRLTDFGLARLLDRESDLTRTVALLGTPAYLAPELAAGRARAATTAADVYGLGAILYEALTGRPPYAGETPLAVLGQVQAGPPVPPSRVQSAVPRDLEVLVLRAMHREPPGRFPAAGALADELERWLRGEPIRSRAVPWWEELRAWARRRPAVALALATALFALLVGLSATSWQWFRAERTAGRLLEELALAESRHAERLFNANEPREGMARLAISLRRQPADPLAATRLAAALLQREWARPLFELGPHAGQVLQTAWSPDGGVILTAGADGQLRAWDAAGGAALPGSWIHGPAACLWLAWSADGKFFGSRLEDGSLRVWPRDGGGPVMHDEPPGDAVKLAAFAPSGARLAVVRADGTVELWDPAAAACLWRRPHPAGVTALDFTHDGRRLATADATGAVQALDAETGGELGEPLRAQDAVRGLSWHPDGHRLALTLTTNRQVEVWGWPERTRHQTLRQELATVAAFTPDGLLLRQVRSLGGFTATNPDTRTERYRIVGAREPLLDCVFSPDGRHGVAALDALNLRAFVAGGGQPLAEPVRTRWSVESVALSPDGLRLAVAAGPVNATVWALRPSRAEAGMVSLPGASLAAAFSADGTRFWSCDRAGVLRALDLAAPGSPTERRLPGGGLSRAAFSPDARRVAGVGPGGEMTVYDVAGATAVARPWPLPGEVTALAFSADGRWLAAGLADEQIVWFDLAAGTAAGRADLRPGAPVASLGSQVRTLDFSPDGTALAAGTYGGVAAVFETASGRRRLWLPHPAPVWRLRFSPDGRRLATACGNGTVQVWEGQTGRPAAPPMLHEDEAYDVRFTPDGRRLVTAGADNSLRVWDAATGGQLQRARTVGKAYLAAVAPAEGWMAAAASGATTRLWDMATGLALGERLPIPGGANRSLAAADGRWLALWQHGGGIRLYPVPCPPAGPVPPWLPDVAEATAGLRFGAQGELQYVTPGETIALAARLRGVREADPVWAQVLRRFTGEEP